MAARPGGTWPERLRCAVAAVAEWRRLGPNPRQLPWHRAALLGALGIADTAGNDVEVLVGDAIAQRSARDVEETVYDAGGLAVAARGAAE